MRVPRLIEGVSLTSVVSTPDEQFTLEAIDGRSPLEEIAASRGQTVEQVMGLVARLEAIGALEWILPPARGSRPPPPSAPARRESFAPARELRDPSVTDSRAPRATPGRGIVRTKPAPPDAPRQLYDPTELEEVGVDLDSERRREILDAFYRLDHLDHYQLLGVERDADKKDIRESYFRLSKTFHPDTLFGKRLGTYKVKMEAVFRRLTDAYEVLSKAKKRERYDDYLRAKELSERVQRGLAEGESQAAALDREAHEAAKGAVHDPIAAPRATTPARHASAIPRGSAPPSEPPPKAPSNGAMPIPEAPPSPVAAPPPSRPPAPADAAPRPTPTPGPAEARPTSVTSSRAPLDEEAKRQLARELLERRLKGATGRTPTSSLPPRPPSPPPAPADKDALLRGLASSLRQAARVTAGGDRAERQLQDARAAEQRGDLVAAVNSLRLATSLAPERDDIAHELDRVRHLLAKQLAETYERQARYEEENGEHAAAGRSWMKVAEGRPERYVYPMYAAQAFLKANVELKLAKDLAERAVQLAPENARVRALLAEVFLRAGMKANAKRELDAAAKLDPEADFVKHLRRELK
jgi:curved DNA-binding protein CbpA